MTLLAEMKRLVDSQSQFIIATHSPILLAYPDAAIYQITEDRVEKVSYEDCDNYKNHPMFRERPNGCSAICLRSEPYPRARAGGGDMKQKPGGIAPARVFMSFIRTADTSR
jgi:hypothetical protein